MVNKIKKKTKWKKNHDNVFIMESFLGLYAYVMLREEKNGTVNASTTPLDLLRVSICGLSDITLFRENFSCITLTGSKCGGNRMELHPIQATELCNIFVVSFQERFR